MTRRNLSDFRRPRVWRLAAFLVFVALPALSQTASTDAYLDHAEMAGVYRLARSPADLAGNTPTHVADLNAYIASFLQPWAKLRMEETNGVADDTAAVCHADGIFRLQAAVGGLMVLPTKDRVTIVFGELEPGGVRRIYMNQEHPPNIPPTWNGHSVGHWDNDTLVVDTIGFNDKSWLMTGMQPHTEELHVVERIRYIPGPKLLEIVSTSEDRHALTGPFTYSRYYKKTGTEMAEDVCNGEPGDQELWLGFRNYALKKGYTPAPSKKEK